MSPLYPRLLVDDFGACFRFYRDVLPELSGATLARGAESGPYASWDAGDDTALALFARAAMAAAVGDRPADATGAPAADRRVLLVVRVDDVDAATEFCARHGGRVAVPPQDRPEWGPTMRAAHVLDPDGNLIEVQSY